MSKKIAVLLVVLTNASALWLKTAAQPALSSRDSRTRKMLLDEMLQLRDTDISRDKVVGQSSRMAKRLRGGGFVSTSLVTKAVLWANALIFSAGPITYCFAGLLGYLEAQGVVTGEFSKAPKVNQVMFKWYIWQLSLAMLTLVYMHISTAVRIHLTPDFDACCKAMFGASSKNDGVSVEYAKDSSALVTRAVVILCAVVVWTVQDVAQGFYFLYADKQYTASFLAPGIFTILSLVALYMITGGNCAAIAKLF
mmetsp:Transcript_32265/g.53314  ORF Transcript_32265/g.53314 Transcript_32265/m.53314 type:complete len:252 (+) Transcript_32265:20-775(+)|eukprot:CAMPEP_0119320822 /NCGR_PEP_ID=MMETSP1333-20130426/53556_1 /TAXON_ID=418940 /ORGANISM="Scyphosphaera apsteinii, Strain RCC1455" /LENGTH=251 /DNA_ID=CAMNT_0007327627 /DNA_START=14 /DNA_END=769 /DNA_ORIENTATION=-